MKSIVKELEEEAGRIINEAKRRAEEIVKNARKRAEEVLSDKSYLSDLEREKNELEARVRGEIDAIINNAIAEARLLEEKYRSAIDELVKKLVKIVARVE